MLQRFFETVGLRQPEHLPRTRTFFLEPNDDVASVLDRLDWAGVERVILVVPPDSPDPEQQRDEWWTRLSERFALALRSAVERLSHRLRRKKPQPVLELEGVRRKRLVLSDRLDLIRVQRHAAQRGIELALVALDPDQRTVARDLKIPVFFSVDKARRTHWRHPLWRHRPPSAPPKRRKGRPRPEELRPGDSRLAGYVLLGMSGGAVLALVYYLLTASRLDLKALGKQAALGGAGGVAAGLAVFILAWMLQSRLPRLFYVLRWSFMALVFVLGLLAPIAAGVVIAPGARLTLTPAEKTVSAIARITVVVPPPGQEGGLEEIDFEGQRIAGRRVSAEVGGEAIAGATGTTEVPSSRATGTVVFSNLLPQDYTVARGAVVRTSAGSPVRFVTTGDVTVPPLGQAAVGIEAMEPGPLGNVDVGLINRVEGAVARAVRVTNPEPTRGGGVSEVRAVTETDREDLRRTLLAELRDQGYERVLERPEAEGGLREGEYLVPGSVRVFQVLHETYDRFATEEAESVKLGMRVMVTGVVVDAGDAMNLARYVLDQRVPEDYELLDAQYVLGLMGDNVIGDGTLTFFVEAEGVAEAQLQPEQVKRWLRGKPFEEGMVLLDEAWRGGELPVASLPEVEIWPNWAADRFPRLIWRIEISEAGEG